MDWERAGGLSNQVLIIDGLSGTGKTMLSKVVGDLKNFSAPRYFYSLEWALQGASAGSIAEDFFKAWVSLLTDQLTYDHLLSREVNFRPSDLTSVLRSPSGLSALASLLKKDGRQVLEQTAPPGLAIITHQSFGAFQSLDRTLEDRLIWLEMVRRPLDLVAHWASYVKNHGSSPSDFTLMKKVGRESVPWFIDSANTFARGNLAEKTLTSLISLYSKLENFHEDSIHRNNVLLIPFEHFVAKPWVFIAAIERVSGTLFRPSVRRTLKRERVPRTHLSDGRPNRAYQRHSIPEGPMEIVRMAPRHLQDRFLALDEEYAHRYPRE